MFVNWRAVPSARAFHDGPHSVYALVDPQDETVRYVGYTSRPIEERLSGHLLKPTNRAMRNWIRGLRALGQLLSIRLLIAVTEDWEAAEQGWIAWFRQRGNLYNIDPGGIVRTKSGKPIKRRMRRARLAGDWRQLPQPQPKKAKQRDPWGKHRETPAAIAAEVSAKQMRRPKDSDRESQQDPVAGSGKLCPTQPDGDDGRRSLPGEFTGRGPGDET